ncbi:MAG TPA: alpha/beta fold hydrolase [Pyrinomonadaceae bacterium]|jgi:dienelactone hydrolase|nr:alpha/beta fold hydrolase [Pyrinomonadaceae bacterium]
MKRVCILLFLFFVTFTATTNSQTISGPSVVTVPSGSLKLRALLWKPKGRGPFPAVLFSPGSGQSPSPDTLGRTFAKHGYIFLALFRRGQGLSSDQGEESSVLWTRERATKGDDAANRLQLQLLEGEELDAQRNALAVLRSLRGVDPHRVAIIGHSFGGSLSLVHAAEDSQIRAVVIFGGAAASWVRSPNLRERLTAAVRKISAPVFFIYAANDYSTVPGEVLSSEMEAQNKVHLLKIYPAFGKTQGEGHSIIYLSMQTWEHDVFEFLGEHTARR